MSPQADSTERVYLRALALTDLDACTRWHNSASLFDNLPNGFRHVSPTAEEAWLRRRMEYSDREVNAAICLRSDNTHIGNIYLRDIDPRAMNAALGLFIGDPEHRGQGHGSSALRLMLRHAFNDLGMHRIYLYALARNLPAIRSYQRVGFTLEGTLRDHAFKEGKFHDVVVLGLQSHEFNSGRSAGTQQAPA